jgi:hypothetical protein
MHFWSKLIAMAVVFLGAIWVCAKAPDVHGYVRAGQLFGEIDDRNRRGEDVPPEMMRAYNAAQQKLIAPTSQPVSAALEESPEWVE